MLDSTEKKIIETFNKHQVNISSDEVFNRVSLKNENKGFFKWWMIAIPSFSVACVLLLLLIPQKDNSLIEDKINQKDFISNVVGASSTLNRLNNTKQLKKLTSLNENYIVEAYENIQQIAMININSNKLEYNLVEEKNVLFDIEYNYNYQIVDKNFNQNYTFVFNLNENYLNGIIYNSTYIDYAIFSIKVECEFLVNNDSVNLTSIFTPQLMGNSLSYSFSVEEKEDSSTTYSYLMAEETLFNYNLFKQDNITQISYESLGANYLFKIEKVSEEIYIVNYSMLEIINGSFSVIYDLSTGEYEINFEN